MPMLPFFLLLPLIGTVKGFFRSPSYYGRPPVYKEPTYPRSGWNKVDPGLMDRIQAQESDTSRLIIFAKNLEEARSLIAGTGFKVIYSLPFISGYTAEGPLGGVKQLVDMDQISYILGDSKVQSLMNIVGRELHTREIFQSEYTGKDIGIAFLDTGIFPHMDFTRPANRITGFKDFVNGQTDPYDDNGHGTFVAGVAAGNGFRSNGTYTGIAPEANIVGVKVMDQDGSGNTSDILAGMQWVLDQREKLGIRVMSLSLGMSPENISGFDVLSHAAERVWKQGIVVTAAAGNEGPDPRTISSPGGSPSIITVGALDDKRTVDTADDVVADFSSRGPSYTGAAKPDILAPGVDITSVNSVTRRTVSNLNVMLMGQYYKSMSGTSVATPIAAGAAALALQKHPDWRPRDVKNAMVETASSMEADRFAAGAGSLNLQGLMDK